MIKPRILLQQMMAVSTAEILHPAEILRILLMLQEQLHITAAFIQL
jgi:hypothetical protein